MTVQAEKFPAKKGSFVDKEKPREVRYSNITAAKSIVDAIRTSLGPKGMDKMIQTSKGQVILTNDGATILKNIGVLHPAAKMLVELSAAQDAEAGDGTTSVVILCGSMLIAAETLLERGIHPTIIAETFQEAAQFAIKVFRDMAIPIELSDRETLIRAAKTSLNSKIVSHYSSTLAPIAVDAVLRVIDPDILNNVDLSNIRIIRQLGGTIEDTELAQGLVLNQKCIKSADGPKRIEKAKIALIQFQLSPPKPDMENQIIVNDYRQMDKILKEERQYLLNICKKIKKSGANVVLIQKSILRDAVNDLSLHFLAKLKIMAIKDIERDEVNFICRSLGCKAVADIESLTEDKLGFADCVEEINFSGSSFVKVTGARNEKQTVSIVCRGANNLVLEECERSIHDALCVVRCLVKERALLVGGGASELEASQAIFKHSTTLSGTNAACFAAFAEALEIIPITLAENSGLNSIKIVTELRNQHAQGNKLAGVNIRKGNISDVLEESVLQPLLVNTSELALASETVKIILKVDDITFAR